MISTDEAVELIKKLMKDNSDSAAQVALTAVGAGVTMFVAEGGADWNFMRVIYDITLTSSRSEYYINRENPQTQAAAYCFSAAPSDIVSIRDIWSESYRLQKLTFEDYAHTYLGRTTTGRPKAWAPFGNSAFLGPIPDSAYPLKIFAAKKVTKIEDLPDQLRFAALLKALEFIFHPNSPEYLTAQSRAKSAFATARKFKEITDYSREGQHGGY